MTTNACPTTVDAQSEYAMTANALGGGGEGSSPSTPRLRKKEIKEKSYEAEQNDREEEDRISKKTAVTLSQLKQCLQEQLQVTKWAAVLTSFSEQHPSFTPPSMNGSLYLLQLKDEDRCSFGFTSRLPNKVPADNDYRVSEFQGSYFYLGVMVCTYLFLSMLAFLLNLPVRTTDDGVFLMWFGIAFVGAFPFFALVMYSYYLVSSVYEDTAAADFPLFNLRRSTALGIALSLCLLGVCAIIFFGTISPDNITGGGEGTSTLHTPGVGFFFIDVLPMAALVLLMWVTGESFIAATVSFGSRNAVAAVLPRYTTIIPANTTTPSNTTAAASAEAAAVVLVPPATATTVSEEVPTPPTSPAVKFNLTYPLSVKVAAYVRIQPLVISSVALALCSIHSWIILGSAKGTTVAKSPMMTVAALSYLLMVHKVLTRTDVYLMYRRQESYVSFFGFFSVYYWGVVLVELALPMLLVALDSTPVVVLGCILLIVLLVALPAVFLYVVAIWCALRRRTLGRRIEQMQATGGSPSSMATPTSTGLRVHRVGNCASCGLARATEALVPCGHVALCSSCTKVSVCPLCHHRVDSQVAISYE